MGRYVSPSFAKTFEPLEVMVEYTVNPFEMTRRKHEALMALLEDNEELVVVGRNAFWELAPIVTELSEFSEFESQRLNGKFQVIQYVKMDRAVAEAHRSS